MIDDLIASLNEDNSYIYDSRIIFHEEEIYNAFNCSSLDELRQLNKELVAEGLIQYVYRNFYITTKKIK